MLLYSRLIWSCSHACWLQYVLADTGGFFEDCGDPLANHVINALKVIVVERGHGINAATADNDHFKSKHDANLVCCWPQKARGAFKAKQT